MKLAMMTSKKAMLRSTMSMGNFLFTDYKVHNVSYRRKYAFPNPVFESLRMNFVKQKKKRSPYLFKVIFLSDFPKALPRQFFFKYLA